MAKTLMMAVVEAKGSRQVAAAVASALLRAGGDDADLGGSSMAATQAVKQLDLHEQLVGIVEETYGPGMGIGATCKKLRDGGYTEVASAISNVHRGRKMVAHPTASLAARLRTALQRLMAEEVQQGGGQLEVVKVYEEKVQHPLGQLEMSGDVETCLDMQNDNGEKVRHPLGQLERSGDDMQKVNEEKDRHSLGQLDGQLERSGEDMQKVDEEKVRLPLGQLETSGDGETCQVSGGGIDHELIMKTLEEMKSDMDRYVQTGYYKQQEGEG